MTEEPWTSLEGEQHPTPYADAAAEAALDPSDEHEHQQVVREIGAKNGFPIPNWMPTITRQQ